MGFFKKLIGQEPLMKTILGEYDFITTNIKSNINDLKLTDISYVKQTQVILHTVSENSFRVELKSLDKSTILQGMAIPEDVNDYTCFQLLDFDGTGQYLLELSDNDLKLHSHSKKTTLRYVNVDIQEIGIKKEKLKEIKNRSVEKKQFVSKIFSRTNSKNLIKLEKELIQFLKEIDGANLYGDIYDILPKYVCFDFERDWYNKFTDKYSQDENLLLYILKGYQEKINHIPKAEIEAFLHLHEKFVTVRLLKGAVDENQNSLYDLLCKIRAEEVKESFRSIIIRNEHLIPFSIAYEKFADNQEDFFELNEKIEELNEDDSYLSFKIYNKIESLLNFFYISPNITLVEMKDVFLTDFQLLKAEVNNFKNIEAKDIFLNYMIGIEGFIEQYS